MNDTEPTISEKQETLSEENSNIAHSWSIETIVINGKSMTVMFPSEDMDE